MRTVLSALVMVLATMASAHAETRCVLLATEAGRELLVNRCGECRQVKVQRTRAGESFPTSRDYIVQSGTEMTLPFRGSGSTRVLSEGECEGTARKPGLDTRNCITIAPDTKAGPVIMNSCDECRSARIEIRERNGQRSSKTYMVAPQSYVPFTNPNALDARILSQSICQR